MSRKRTSDGAPSKFKRLLGWTVLMAIVFSAGLITGERLVRREALAPLVSVTDQVPEADSASDAQGADGQAEESEKEKTTFAFFDQLARKDDVALSANRDSKPTKQKKAKEKAPKPAKKPAADKKTDEKPAKARAPKQATKPAEKPAEPASADAKAEQPEKLAARYTLQVAAHPDMDSAKQHMERLRKMGLEPHVISASIPGKGKFYRVRVGKFHSMEEARNFQASLKSKNSLNTFVTPL